MTEDERDAASLKMELQEVAGREETIRNMAQELALALKAAHRIILAVPDSAIPSHVWANNWPLVDRIMNQLVQAEEA